MIYKKVVSLGAGYASPTAYEYDGKKFEADIKDGDIIKIVDAGAVVQGKFAEQKVHKIETRNGVKALPLNQTSINNLIDAFGEDSDNWVGKEVKVWIFKVPKEGKMTYQKYLAPSNWEMDENGKFNNPGADAVPSDENDIELP